MAEKLTTASQLKNMALRARNDSADRIAELAGLVASGLEEVQHSAITLTLPKTGWTNNAQTIKHKSLRADNNFWYIICNDAGIEADDITIDGQITFRCNSVPSADLTVDILRLEVTI